MAMSHSISRNEYLREVTKQYKRSTKKEKSALLDAAAVITGLHRKYLILRLRHPGIGGRTGKQEGRGRKRVYDDYFHDALLVCWHSTNHICAERLQPFLPELVPKLIACGELHVSEPTRQLLLRASISTVTRHLRREQRRSHVSFGTTKPGSLLKHQIAVRHGRWQETNPGWLETDTVAHCGESAEGQFVYTYDFVDIATSWSEQVASLGKGERATGQSFGIVRKRFPFSILGIDSDNGSEFINNHLRRYCQREGLAFTRSRPYHKNDNAHVEQKNWTAVRKVVGYDRLDTEEQLSLLNELYSGPLRLYLNYFQPTRKRKSKVIDTATGTKRVTYFEARTPYQRVMEHPKVSQTTKDMLQSTYNKLNPVELLAEIEALVERIHKSQG